MALLSPLSSTWCKGLGWEKTTKKIYNISSSTVEEENLIQLTSGEDFAGKCCLSCSCLGVLWCSSFIISEHTFLQLPFEDVGS